MSALRINRTRGFTLIELIVVMGIVAIVATVTVIAVGAISSGSRQSIGVNSVMVALENARALAMKNNEIVMACFRVKYDAAQPDERQVTEIVLCRWSGSAEGLPAFVKDIYVPIFDAPVRRLPAGIKVAVPWYDYSPGGNDADDVWVTQPQFPLTQTNGGETPGRMFGILYGPDGSVLTRHPTTSASELYVDLNNGLDGDGDGRRQDIWGSIGASDDWVYDDPRDEVNIELTAYLCVYDDDAARKVKSLDWSSETNYILELTGPAGFITRTADRIHFNRYTGVALR